jgi:hypothetical protein
MAVIINELEIVLEPDAPKESAQKAGGKPDPAKPPLAPQDVLTVLDREHRNHLRLMAH